MALDFLLVTIGSSIIWALALALVGTLLFEKIMRRGFSQKGILPYLLINIGVVIFIIGEILRSIGIDLPSSLLWIRVIWVPIFGSVYLWNTFNTKDNLNRANAITVCFICWGIGTFEVLKILYEDPIYWVVNVVFMISAMLLFYYGIICFLRRINIK